LRTKPNSGMPLSEGPSNLRPGKDMREVLWEGGRSLVTRGTKKNICKRMEGGLIICTAKTPERTTVKTAGGKNGSEAKEAKKEGLGVNGNKGTDSKKEG